MSTSKRCNYSYDALRQIGIAMAGLSVDNGKIEMEEAKTDLMFFLSILQICRDDKDTAQKLLKIGKKADEKSKTPVEEENATVE